ncbi:MAG TPA: sensor histidine kinase [Sphingomicrobium sp.]
MTLAERFERLSTAAKLLLILTAVLLPIGILLTWVGESGIRQANAALKGRQEDQSQNTALAIESLIGRNALALRIAASGALAGGPAGACDRARQSLAIAPAVAQNFELETADGKPVCATGQIGDTGGLPLAGPGDVLTGIADSAGIAVRAGVNGGMATAIIPIEELKATAAQSRAGLRSLAVHDQAHALRIVDPPEGDDAKVRYSEWPIGHGGISVRVGTSQQRIRPLDRLLLLLPVFMWVAAALITWLLVSRLLIRPLKRLEHAVLEYHPGEDSLDLPHNLGPAQEIQELRDAFARVVGRVQESEDEMTGALEGQRRLVREVHHRVKNNLQVIASLLNIHGRGAETNEARAAYGSISRRVGALSIVHRNHFAEMEESRGISLRPLIAELAAELRAGAPEPARGLMIDLDLETVYTTQDVAVAVAFLITEVVEFSMLSAPQERVEITLERTSELTARLALSTRVLNPDEQELPEKVQFERILAGLAKQLRSPLDRKFGRYSVDLPAFPPL